MRDDPTNADPPIPEAIRRVRAPLHTLPLPEDLDASTLALIRTAASAQSAPPARSAVRTPAVWRKPRVWYGAAAANALFALGFGWYALRQSPAPLQGELVRLSGGLDRDGEILESRTESGDGLAVGETFTLADDGLLYLQYAPGFTVRIIGPARFRVRATGLALEAGRLALFASADRLSGAELAEQQRAHAAFRIETARAEYRLLGTMAELHVSAAPARTEVLRVLDGALGVRLHATSAELRAGAGSAFNAVERRAFALEPEDRVALQRVRASLIDPRSSAALNLEEIRAIYGSVSEFTLRDGRILQGFLVRTEAGEAIQTPAGPVAVEPADILSFTLLDAP